MNIKPMEGMIGYFGLDDWWLSILSEQERQSILEKFQPMGLSGSSSLTSGDIKHSSQSVVQYLTILAGWFYKKEDRPIAYKILGKAKELSKQEGNVLDLHFLYGEMLGLNYKDRENPDCFKNAIHAGWDQIQLSTKAADAFKLKHKNEHLPSHAGYKQLAIVLEKQKKYVEAVSLCEKSLSQGWGGDWEKRIERCKKKIVK